MINQSINRFFLKLQVYLFGLLVVGIMAGILFGCIGQGMNCSVVVPQFLWFVIVFYFPIVVALEILHFLILKVEPFQLHLFYDVWINRVFKACKNAASGSAHEIIRRFSKWVLTKQFNDYYDSLILDSWKPQKLVGNYADVTPRKAFGNQPVLVRREHLIAKGFWPNWAFAAIVLFNKLRMSRHQKGKKTRIRLEVDLRDQSYGIYNGAGKAFLVDKFLEGRESDVFTQKSRQVEDFLNGSTEGDEIEINAADTPLRWASGGVLPIACWKQRYWCVLSFRGIVPVGWNLANGSSETKEEYKNLHSLMVRELSEEIVLLEREPKIDNPAPISQRLFCLDSLFDELPEMVKDKIRSKAFVEKHRELRSSHDSLNIRFVEGPSLARIETPFEVQIGYHSQNLRQYEITKVESVVFSINPFEFGIESVGLYSFDMNDNDYLMFGETWEVANCLLREPIILLSCDYLQKLFKKNGGSLGERAAANPHLDCKSIARIPKEEFHIFDKDVAFRKRRVEQLAKQEFRTHAAEEELKLHKGWLSNYEKLFRDLNGQDIVRDKHLQATMLCPVTWKTIELVCRYDILGNLLR